MNLSQEIIAALADEFGCVPEHVNAWLAKHSTTLPAYLRRHHLPDYAALIEEGDRA